MQEEAVSDIRISVEQFAVHLQTTISALQDSTTQLTDSFKSVVFHHLSLLTVLKR